MATITIRNVPEDLIHRVKEIARGKGRSMEQELRELLKAYYAGRYQVLSRVRRRWEKLPPLSPEEVERWKEEERL